MKWKCLELFQQNYREHGYILLQKLYSKNIRTVQIYILIFLLQQLIETFLRT